MDETRVGTVDIFTHSQESATTSGTMIVSSASPISAESMRSSARTVENAVYAHIRALRALGRSTVNTHEIAQALNINPGRVMDAIHALKTRGVKVAE